MMNFRFFLYPLILLNTAFAAVDLTAELQQLNQRAVTEEGKCNKLVDELKSINALDSNINPNGPTFKSKELAMKSLKVLAANDTGPSENTLKAYQLLRNEKNWPEDKTFQIELAKIPFECALFEKYDIFWAYSIDHKKLGFSNAEHALFKEQFKKYFESALKVPGPFMSLLIRAATLLHFSEAKLLGSEAHLTKVLSLRNEMEEQRQHHQKNLKAKEAGNRSMRHEMELSNTYIEKLKTLYTSMK